MTTVFQLSLKCQDCGHKYRRIVPSEDAPDPPCPKCAVMPKAPIGLDVTAGRAPAIGGNATVRAMDYTMEAVAQDYGFTDLKTDGRQGATMAPPLPKEQQAAADAMFNPTLRQEQLAKANPVVAAKMRQIAATAMAGGYRQNNPRHAPDPIQAAHQGRQRGEQGIRANFVAGDGVRCPRKWFARPATQP
jgi:hypothetical protein